MTRDEALKQTRMLRADLDTAQTRLLSLAQECRVIGLPRPALDMDRSAKYLLGAIQYLDAAGA